MTDATFPTDHPQCAAARDIDARLSGERASRRALFGVSALLFLAERGGDDRLAHVDVGDGRDADAGRLDDVDGVGAELRADVARRRGVVPRHVDGDDGGDDAAVAGAGAVALSPGRSTRPARPAAVG